MVGRPHVVVVAPLYPSAGGAVPAAAIRTHGLCRAFTSLGYRVDVVCGMPLGESPVETDGVDVHAIGWLDPDGVVERLSRGRYSAAGGQPVPGRALVSRMIPPDRYVSWIPGATRRARALGGRASLVFSTSAKSAHVAGYLVATDRWIADLNDPWVDNPHMPVGPVADAVHRRLERTTLGRASHITAVTPPLRDELARRFGEGRVSTLFSGFDPGPPSPGDVEATPTVLYAGTLYEQLDLTPLFAGVAAARAAGHLAPGQLRFRFVGRLNERVQIEAESRGVGEFFHAQPSIPRAAVLRELGAATALLLPLYADDPYSLPMKFFEYLGAGRPIVALGPADRYAGRLVAERGFGVVAATPADVAALIARLVSGEALPHATPKSAAEFTWSATASTLRRILEKV
ncbi:MAG: glycosyltransferase [Gaiellales bacterium]